MHTLTVRNRNKNSGRVLSQVALAVYDGCPDSGGNLITCVGTDSCGGDLETVNVATTTGVAVYVAVIANAGNSSHRVGSFKLTVTCGS